MREREDERCGIEGEETKKKGSETGEIKREREGRGGKESQSSNKGRENGE